VDDEEAVLEVARRMLESLGYRVTAIGGGPEALEAFARDPGEFDLVVADLAMPKMSGLTLLREILRLRPDIPAILCTGYGGGPDQAQVAGIRQVLQKPILPGQLGRAARAALDRVFTRDASGEGTQSPTV
jgi:CheY-like chemotaxis protein